MDYTLIWIFVSAGVLFMIAEVVTTNLVFLMLGGGAVAGALAAALGAPIWVTGLAFLAVAAAGLFLLRPRLLKIWGRVADTATGAEAMIGSSGFVVQLVTQRAGLVFVNGQEWSARSEGEDIEKDATVTVTRLDGALAIVEQLSTETNSPPFTPSPESGTH